MVGRSGFAIFCFRVSVLLPPRGFLFLSMAALFDILAGGADWIDAFSISDSCEGRAGVRILDNRLYSFEAAGG